jgi:phosphatidylglycerol:prolipoprotein diacylglycerol transferase
LGQVHPVLFHIGAFVIPSNGVVAAVGVLLALMLALHTARKIHLDPNRIWNLCILVLFAALVGSRLLLVIANWTALRHHPLWVLSLAMVHHPLLAGIGALIALAVCAVYTSFHRLPLRATADALAAPTALAFGFEQIGALLAGSAYGTGAAHVPWAVVYTDPLAARWSDAPLGIPVHPVQAYAALCFFAIAFGLMLWLPHRGQNGDLAGLFLMASGVAIYVTEFWRDPIGRGTVFRGILKGPQAAAILFLICGACLLLKRKSERIAASTTPIQTETSATREQAHG